MPAMVEVEEQCGQFNGYESNLNTGGHLGTYVMDGLFAGDWVSQLKFTAAFTLDPSWDSTPVGTKWGIVTYGDCAAGSSFAFSVEKTATETIFVISLELQNGGILTDGTLEANGVSDIHYYFSTSHIVM